MGMGINGTPADAGRPSAGTGAGASRRPPLVLALLLWIGVAQGVAQDRPVFRFDQWTSDDGLPSQFVSDLAQTGDGHLWAVVARRLVRFDGRRMTVFSPGQAEGLPAEDPFGIGAGSGDTLWIVTERGRVVSHAAGRFRVQAHLDRELRDVATDRGGRLWVWSHREIFRIDDSTYRRVGTGPEYLPQAEEMRPTAVPTAGGGIWVAGATLRSVDSLGRPVVVGPSHFSVIVDYRDGSPVVGRPSSASIALFRPTGELIGSIPSSGARNVRLVDRAGRIWTTREGFAEAWQNGTAQPVATVALGAGVRVRMMIQDQEDNVWIGTSTEGLFRVQEVPFAHFGQKDGILDRQVLWIGAGGGNAVTAIDQTGNGYWIESGRVDRVYTATPSSSPLHEGRFAHAAFGDARGTHWLFLYGSARERDLVGRSGRGPAIRIPVDSTLSIRRLMTSPHDPDLLLASGEGMAAVRAYGPRRGTIEQYLPTSWLVRQVVVDAANRIWAIARDSVARIDEHGVTKFPLSDPQGANQFRAILPLGDTLLVGTYGRGLHRIGGPPHEPLTEAAGLGENIVSQIIADGLGNLWMAGDRSIHRVSLAEVRAWFADSIPRVNGVRYGRLAGIPNPEGSGYDAYRSPDGRIWFPTFDGIAVVDPARALRLDRHQPQVRVEHLVVDGQTVAATDTARLRRVPNTLAIAFSAVSLRDPDAVLAGYRLVGRDSTWIPAGGQREIQFGALTGGDYRFEVRARSAGGGGYVTGPGLAIVVPPAFRDTPWFYLLLVGGLVATGWGTARIRSRRLIADQARLERTVEERTRDLQRQQQRTEEALNTVAWQAEQLQALDRARTRFFSNVTHELRTPLTLILGPLRDLTAGRRGRLPDTAQEDFGLVRQNAERLQQLVDQLLDLARAEAGAMPLRVAPVEAGDFLRRVAGPFEAHARSIGKGFALDLNLGERRLSFDPDYLEKILSNLLGNAFNYTPEGGRVTLAARIENGPDGDWLAIRVTDTGKGIPADQIERIFDRFHRVDERHRTAPTGSGLGLALVKELVALHGGTVAVESEVGRGTEFTVRIPTTGQADTPTPAPAPPPDPSSADRPTVLVVEDHPDMRTFIRRHLEPRYRIIEAGDGREGLSLAREVVPDAIVSDVMMPAMNGEELCQAIRADPDLDFIPVVLLTAKSAHESRLAGLRHGANAYLTKPFDAEELGLTVRNAVDSQRRLRERFRSAGRALPTAPPPASLVDTGQDADRFVARLHEVLAARVGDEDLDVDALAKALDMSRSTFYRRFQESFNRPPMELIWEFRLDQAAAWLKGTDATVAEVAYGVGFKSVPHFTRRFRERFDTTPAAYRRA
ncbi:MAG: ATP-binding protein [Gemmatimonadales bacterium]|nr:ATP-binding protein [Gemmatimonadales bacterium]